MRKFKTYDTFDESVARLTERFEKGDMAIFLPILDEQMEHIAKHYAGLAEIETGSILSLKVNPFNDEETKQVIVFLAYEKNAKWALDLATALAEEYRVDIEIRHKTTKETLNELVLSEDFRIHSNSTRNYSSVSAYYSSNLFKNRLREYGKEVLKEWCRPNKYREDSREDGYLLGPSFMSKGNTPEEDCEIRLSEHYERNHAMAFISAFRIGDKALPSTTSADEPVNLTDINVINTMKIDTAHFAMGYDEIRNSFDGAAQIYEKLNQSALLVYAPKVYAESLRKFAISLSKEYKQSTILLIYPNGTAYWVYTQVTYKHRIGDTEYFGRCPSLNQVFEGIRKKNIQKFSLQEKMVYMRNKKNQRSTQEKFIIASSNRFHGDSSSLIDMSIINLRERNIEDFGEDCVKYYHEWWKNVNPALTPYFETVLGK